MRHIMVVCLNAGLLFAETFFNKIDNTKYDNDATQWDKTALNILRYSNKILI